MSGTVKKVTDVAFKASKSIVWEGMAKLLVSDEARKEFSTLRRTFDEVNNALQTKFASRLLAWIVGRIIGASIVFRFGGWKCVKDIVLKFKKGPAESVSFGEIKVSLRQSLVKLGVGIVSKDPKLQLLISDLELVLRPSNKSPEIAKTQKPRSSGSGRAKWMVVANMARFLSVSVTDMVVKMVQNMAVTEELMIL